MSGATPQSDGSPTAIPSLHPEHPRPEPRALLLVRSGHIIVKGSAGLVRKGFDKLRGLLDGLATKGARAMGLGPERAAEKVVSFLGTDGSCVKKLDELYYWRIDSKTTSKPRGSTPTPPGTMRKLQSRCKQLAKYTHGHPPETQLLAFKGIVMLTTRFIGLRWMFAELLASKMWPTPLDASALSQFWRASASQGTPEWDFFRAYAAYCITASDHVTLAVEECPPSHCGRHVECVTENLICLIHRAQSATELSKLAAIRYLGGILNLTTFWSQRVDNNPQPQGEFICAKHPAERNSARPDLHSLVDGICKVGMTLLRDLAVDGKDSVSSDNLIPLDIEGIPLLLDAYWRHLRLPGILQILVGDDEPTKESRCRVTELVNLLQGCKHLFPNVSDVSEIALDVTKLLEDASGTVSPIQPQTDRGPVGGGGSLTAGAIHSEEPTREDDSQELQASPGAVDDEHPPMAAQAGIDDREPVKECDPPESQTSPGPVDGGHHSVAVGADDRAKEGDPQGSQTVPEAVGDDHRSVKAVIEDRESLRKDEPQDLQVVPELVDDKHHSVADVDDIGDRGSLGEDKLRDSQVAPELVDDEHRSAAAGIHDRESLREDGLRDSQVASESVGDEHSSVAAVIDDRESLWEDEPRESQAAFESVDDEHDSMVAAIDDTESLWEDDLWDLQVAPESIDDEHGSVEAGINGRESAKEGGPWESQAAFPGPPGPSYSPRAPHFPGPPGRPHIRASDEVSPDQMARLDITGRIEFQKNRSNLIGEGRHGTIYTASYTRSSGERIPVAIKVIMCTPQNRWKVEERLMREIITWKRVSSQDQVIDLIGLYRTPNEPPHLVMPLYRNNNFLQYMATRHPSERLVRAKEIARGLDLLHGNSVIHGDLKPENIMVSDAGRALIADFGLSVIPEYEGFTTTFAERNVRHSAPELIPQSASPPPKPTKQSDIYSLGILFLQLFDGRVDCLPYNHVPWSKRDPAESALLRRIHDGDRPRRGNHPKISDSMWNIIAACWVADPAARPTIQVIRSWLGQL